MRAYVAADGRAPYRATSIGVVGARVGSESSVRAGAGLAGCLEIDLSTGPECSPDTYRSGGMTY
jgi:hypothetical protein